MLIFFFVGVPSFPLSGNGQNGLPLACDMIKKNVDIGIKVLLFDC